MHRRPVRRNPIYHRNPDEHFRELERRAAAGDNHARAELFIHDLRMGKPVEEIALGILGSLSVRELQGLHLGAADGLADDLAIARHTRPLSSVQGGWFQNHARQDVCPRGHSADVGDGFDYNAVVTMWDSVSEATRDVLVRDGDSCLGEADVEWTGCRRCSASWPNTAYEY